MDAVRCDALRDKSVDNQAANEGLSAARAAGDADEECIVRRFYRVGHFF